MEAAMDRQAAAYVDTRHSTIAGSFESVSRGFRPTIESIRTEHRRLHTHSEHTNDDELREHV